MLVAVALTFHPVDNLNIRHIFKMPNVFGNNYQTFADGLTGNQYIKLVDRLSLFTKSILYLSIYFAICIYRKNSEILK
jgi:hypothetical protein